MVILLVILGIIIMFIGAALLYFICSPMPVVRLLRRGMEDALSYPGDYDSVKEQVEVYKDLEYPSRYGNHTYDFYLPKKEGKHPLVLWVHGGAFVAGDKAGVDDSAGAYMAAQFAVAHANPVLAGQIGVASPLEKNALKCALLFCGPYDVKRMFNVEDKKLRLFISRIGWSFLGKKNWSKAPLISTVTPMDFVTGQTVPCYITDGNTMSFEPQGRALGEALRKNGVKVKERYFAREEYGDVPHEYQMQLETENARKCFADVLEFLGECMG